MENDFLRPGQGLHPPNTDSSSTMQMSLGVPANQQHPPSSLHRQIPSYDSDFSIQEPVTPPYSNGHSPSVILGRFNQKPAAMGSFISTGTGIGGGNGYGPMINGPPGVPRYDRLDKFELPSQEGFFSDWLAYHQPETMNNSSLCYQSQQLPQQQQVPRHQWSNPSLGSINSSGVPVGSGASIQGRTFGPSLVPAKFSGGGFSNTGNCGSFSVGMGPSFVKSTSNEMPTEDLLLADIMHLQINRPPSPLLPQAAATSQCSGFDESEFVSPSLRPQRLSFEELDSQDHSNGHRHSKSSSSFLHVETNDDKFPILVRRDNCLPSGASNRLTTSVSSLSLRQQDHRQSSYPVLRTSTPTSSMRSDNFVGGNNESKPLRLEKSSFSKPEDHSSGKTPPDALTSEHNSDSGRRVSSGGSGGSVASGKMVHSTHANKPRRKRSDDPAYEGLSLESVSSNIFAMCKDQHGCRYLQRKLEENNVESTQLIFSKTYAHISDLMVDPFGNYLVQKLLDYVNEEQRTVLVKHVCQNLKSIALNQHGTRALQKMIGTIGAVDAGEESQHQSKIICEALSGKSVAVALMKDLNGNHVIQKCLKKFSGPGCQFVFDAVADNCVDVATHKHGCCVIQRCLDHANADQKAQLVAVITKHGLDLVQDQYGNYVVQYVLKLGRPEFNEPLVAQFLGHICNLSVQKFSSNVIENCLRIVEPRVQTRIIDEILHSNVLEDLVRDSYANYVIQTALETAQEPTRSQLIENVRPMMPAIRSTPFGRKIQSKIDA